MEKKRLEIKVGLFVFLGLALLGVLLLQFSKSASLWRGTYELHLHAVNVGGIKPRAGVLLAGVQVGSVTDISLDEGGTNVDALADTPTTRGPDGGMSQPLTPPRMKKVTIRP